MMIGIQPRNQAKELGTRNQQPFKKRIRVI